MTSSTVSLGSIFLVGGPVVVRRDYVWLCEEQVKIPPTRLEYH